MITIVATVVITTVAVESFPFFYKTADPIRRRSYAFENFVNSLVKSREILYNV